MEKCFFDRLGVADMEKVHSAVIAWIFSDECTALDIKQKSYLLCDMYKISRKEFQKMRAEVEIQNIDILIITNEGTPNAALWIIENKIKSSQHSNQLDKYISIAEEIEGKEKHFCFLTLVGEKPQCNNPHNNDAWKNLKYSELATLMKDLALQNNVDAIILNEYRKCITNLANALDDFLQNHRNYPNVFIDGAKKKGQKPKPEGEGSYVSYISENGLETIFQKCFLSYLNSQTKFFQNEFNIKESHGTAFIEGYVKRNIKNTGTDLGIQIQNGTFKVQIYQPEANIKIFWDKWDNVFQKIDLKNWKLNESKSHSIPYFSYSQSIKDWHRKPIDEILKIWEEKLEECRNASEELMKYC